MTSKAPLAPIPAAILDQFVGQGPLTQDELVAVGQPIQEGSTEVRRVIYTTLALESVHVRLRKIITTRGHFPNDEAATKLLYPDRFTTANA